MLETALTDILAAKTPQGCGLARWMDTLDDDDRARVDELIRHPDLGADEIVAALAPYYVVSATTLRRHRRSIRGTAAGCGCR